MTPAERKRPLPPTYLILGLAAMAASHFLFPGPRLVHGGWRLVGVPIAAFGFAIMLWSDALFKKLGTTIKPFDESSVLVVRGPYRLSRHPMYVSFIVMLVGAGILAGTTFPLVLLAVMIWLFRTHFVIPEERHMEEQFGSEYAAYRERVRRWF